MLKKTLAVMSFLALTAALPAFAAEEGQIELTSAAEVERKAVNDKGVQEVKSVDASKANVVPGEVVRFTTAYRHVGKSVAEGVVVTNPVPEHMVYVDRSAEGRGARIEFSVDNGKTYASAKNLKVTGKDGKTRPAVAAEYTHVRWTLEKPLKPGAKGAVSFKAKVK